MPVQEGTPNLPRDTAGFWQQGELRPDGNLYFGRQDTHGSKSILLYDASGNPLLTTTNPGYVASTDGALATVGTTTDASTANTVIGRLKNLLSLLPAALSGAGNLKTAVVEALPAGTNSIGTVVTTLPAARLAADALAMPTAPDVLATLLASNGTTLDRLKQDSTGALRASLYGKQAVAGDTALAVNASGQLGTQLNSNSGVISALAYAARTATAVGPTLNAGAYHGLWIFIYVGVIGTGALTPAVQGLHTAAGVASALWQATTTITATGVYAYLIYPGIGTAKGGALPNAVPMIKEHYSAMLGDNTFNITIFASDTSSWSYQVDYALLP